MKAAWNSVDRPVAKGALIKVLRNRKGHTTKWRYNNIPVDVEGHRVRVKRRILTRSGQVKTKITPL